MTDCGVEQVTSRDLRGFFLRMFAKAAAKHLEKYPYFNKFSFLCMDSLDKFDSDSSLSVPVSVPKTATSSPISTVSYKTSNRSTILISSTRKDSVSSRRATQKPAPVAPVSSVSVSRGSTPMLHRVDSTLPLHTIYDSVSTCQISEIALRANYFRVQSQVSKNRVQAMLDSGATRLFVSKRYAECAKLPLQRLRQKLPLHNINGLNNKADVITHFAQLQLQVRQHNKEWNFLVTD